MDTTTDLTPTEMWAEINAIRQRALGLLAYQTMTPKQALIFVEAYPKLKRYADALSAYAHWAATHPGDADEYVQKSKAKYQNAIKYAGRVSRSLGYRNNHLATITG